MGTNTKDGSGKRAKGQSSPLSIGKKGFFEDVAELFMASIALVALGIIIIVIFNASTAEKKDQVTKEISFLESGYDTNILLKHEIREGYTLADLIIDTVNRKQPYTKLDTEIESIMKKYYDPEGTQAWIFVVIPSQGAQYVHKHNSNDISTAALMFLDGAILPNPDGGNINIIIKEVRKSDELFESGSRDEFLS